MPSNRLVAVLVYRPYGMVDEIARHLGEVEEERVRKRLRGRILTEALNGDKSYAIIVSVPSRSY